MSRPIATSAIRHPLNEILGAEAHIRILRELCLHGGFLSAAHLAAKTDLSKSGMWKALEAMKQSDAVVEEGSERSRLFRFNWNHPFADILSGLFAAENQRLNAVFEHIRNSGELLGTRVVGLWIYGSVARREDKVGSDIDIGVIASPENLSEVTEKVRENLRDPARDLIFLPNVVGLDFNDIVRLAHDNDPWWGSCIADAIVLIGRHPEEVASELLRKSDDGQERSN